MVRSGMAQTSQWQCQELEDNEVTSSKFWKEMIPYLQFYTHPNKLPGMKIEYPHLWK